jgi:hypothetical protein
MYAWVADDDVDVYCTMQRRGGVCILHLRASLQSVAIYNHAHDVSSKGIYIQHNIIEFISDGLNYKHIASLIRYTVASIMSYVVVLYKSEPKMGDYMCERERHETLYSDRDVWSPQ